MDPFSRVTAGGVCNSRPVCRGCLCTDKNMKNLSEGTLKKYFLELANINVSETDSLPQWVCWVCIRMFERSIKFRQKILKCNELLQEQRARCASSPLDVADGEMCKYCSPLLTRTEILLLETSGKKMKSTVSFDYHCLRLKQSEPCVKVESVSALNEPDHDWLQQDFKALTGDETGADIDGVSGSEVKAETPEDGDIYDNDDEVDEDLPLGRLRQKLSSGIVNSGGTDEADALSKRKLKRKSPKKKIKGKEREKRLCKIKTGASDEYNAEECNKVVGKRKTISLDPSKIRQIKLTPAEQAQQREEDSHNETYLKFPFKCERCYKGFNFEQKLQNHMTKHDASRGPYECSVCGMRFLTRFTYNTHAATHSTCYECVACERRMADKPSILEHYAREHEGVVAHYSCDICGKVSTNSRTHRGHIRNHHSGDRPTCDRCGKTFVNKDSLNEHILIHTGVKEHACETCGKLFFTWNQAKQHQRRHSDARKFYCVECDMHFKSYVNLKQHLLKTLRHVDVQSFKYSCDICNKRFDWPRSLKRHVQLQHLRRGLQKDMTPEDEVHNGNGDKGLGNVENDKVLHSQVEIELIEDGQKVMDTQQCLQTTQPIVVAKVATGNPVQVDTLHVKEESESMDIGPTVLQHVDTHYKRDQTQIKRENVVHNEDDGKKLGVIENDQVLCSQGEIELIEDSQEGSDMQQCLQTTELPAVTSITAEDLDQVDALHIKEESEGMDIGPTVLQHVDSHYRNSQTDIKREDKVRNEDNENDLTKAKSDQTFCSQVETELKEDSQKEVGQHQISSDNKTVQIIVQNNHQSSSYEFDKMATLEHIMKYVDKSCNEKLNIIVPSTSETYNTQLPSCRSAIFVCGLCSKQFKVPFPIQRHMLEFHVMAKPNFKCSCDDTTSYDSIDKLMLHKVQYASLKTLIKCDTCNIYFIAWEGLERHKALKVFRCNKCYTTFDKCSLLVEHWRHLNTVGLYKCNACDFRTVNCMVIKNHMASCTPEITITVQERSVS